MSGDPFIIGTAYPKHFGHGLEGDIFDREEETQVVSLHPDKQRELAVTLKWLHRFRPSPPFWRANPREADRHYWPAVERSPLVAATGLLLEPVRHKPYQRHGRRLHNGRLRKA